MNRTRHKNGMSFLTYGFKRLWLPSWVFYFLRVLFSYVLVLRKSGSHVLNLSVWWGPKPIRNQENESLLVEAVIDPRAREDSWTITPQTSLSQKHLAKQSPDPFIKLWDDVCCFNLLISRVIRYPGRDGLCGCEYATSQAIQWQWRKIFSGSYQFIENAHTRIRLTESLKTRARRSGMSPFIFQKMSSLETLPWRLHFGWHWEKFNET